MLETYFGLDTEVLAYGGDVVAIIGNVPATAGLPLLLNEVTVHWMSMGTRPERTRVLGRLA